MEYFGKEHFEKEQISNKKNKKKRIDKEKLSKHFDRFLSIISIVLTIVLTNNYPGIFAKLGNENMQIRVADEARKICDYSTALENYGKIMDKGNSYSQYAALANLEIYNEYYNTEKNYNSILNCFKIASRSDDITVLKACLKFVIEQCDNDLYLELLFNDENISYVTELMNKIYKIEPSVFSDIGLNFPVKNEDVKWLFVEKGLVTTYYYVWKYKSTIVSTESGLCYAGENEKIVSVDSWAERVDPSCASIVIYYKYYKYYKVINDIKEQPAVDVLKEYDFSSEPIYLSSINLEK